MYMFFLCVYRLTITLGPTANLPHDQTKGVDVRSLEALKILDGDALRQDLRSQVASRPNRRPRRSLDHTCCLLVGEREAEIGDAARVVALHEDIATLEVSVGDGGLTLGADNLGVQVIDPARSRVAEFEGGGLGEGLAGEEVKEGSELAVVGDEPELHL